MEDRNYILDKMKSRIMTIDEFDYDRLWAPPLYSLLTPDDIEQLHRLATSIRYTSKPIEKLEITDRIMERRGFRRLGGGTNRMVYKFLEDDSFLIKVATSDVALDDSPREFINQQDLKPFCAKCFEVSPCGTVGLFERVVPITSREEFLSVADMAYDLISNILTGEYVMDDIGTKYFMNYGVRKGFGLVILDYTFRYKLDGNKLYCNNTLPDGSHCGGVIDYDDGYNHLRCTKCGRVYKALELRQAITESKIIKEGGKSKMKIALNYGDEKVYVDTDEYTDTAPKLVSRKKGKKANIGTLKVSLGGSNPIDVKETAEPSEEITIHARGTIVHAPAVEEAPAEEEPAHWSEFEEFAEEIKDEFDDVASDDETNDESSEEVTGYENCAGDVVKAADITYNPEDNFEAIVIYSDDSILCNADGDPLLITELMGKKMSDLIILERSYYDKLVDDANHTSYDEPTPPEVESTKDEEDDGLPYFVDDKGVKRWKSNHNPYKRDDVPVGVGSSSMSDAIIEAMEEQMDDDGIPKKKSSKKKKKR